MGTRDTLVTLLIGLVACALAVAGLWQWFNVMPPQQPRLRIPAPARADAGQPIRATINIEGEFKTFDGRPSALKGAWPWFRGETFDNVVHGGVQLARQWDEAGPPVLWSVELGDGYAAPAVRNGRVYVLDYDQQEKADALRCFSLDDGREIWRRAYRVAIKRNHGISRTVPAVTERHVVSIGPKCHVLCVDAQTGAFRWGMDLIRDYGGEVPLWYTGQCPLIEDGIAILAPAGKVLMIGVDCESGAVVWETPNPDGWQMSHASVVPATLSGKRMFVYAALGGIVAVSADPSDRGAVLWKTTDWAHTVVAPSPVFLSEDRMLVTAGYGVGSRMFKIHERNGTWSVEVLATWPRTHFACEQQTPVFSQGRLFTVMPNDAGPLNRQLVCMEPNGKHLWTSGKAHRFGLGPFMVADGKLLVLDDDGRLTMAKAYGEGFEPLAAAQVLDGREAWGPMALVDGRLLCRDSSRMVCLDLRAEQGVRPEDG